MHVPHARVMRHPSPAPALHKHRFFTASRSCERVRRGTSIYLVDLCAEPLSSTSWQRTKSCTKGTYVEHEVTEVPRPRFLLQNARTCWKGWKNIDESRWLPLSNNFCWLNSKELSDAFSKFARFFLHPRILTSLMERVKKSLYMILLLENIINDNMAPGNSAVW